MLIPCKRTTLGIQWDVSKAFIYGRQNLLGQQLDNACEKITINPPEEVGPKRKQCPLSRWVMSRIFLHDTELR